MSCSRAKAQRRSEPSKTLEISDGADSMMTRDISSISYLFERRIQIQFIIIIIYPLPARVVGPPQMISQPVSSIFPCSLLPSVTWGIPDLSISWCCPPTSCSICLVFFPLLLCLARWFWPDLMNGRHDHITAVCASLRWSGCLRAVRLPAGSWHGLLRWKHGLCMRCGSTSFPWLVFFHGIQFT